LANTFARGRVFFVDADLLLFPAALALAIVVVPPRLILVMPGSKSGKLPSRTQEAPIRLGRVEVIGLTLRLRLSFHFLNEHDSRQSYDNKGSATFAAIPRSTESGWLGRIEAISPGRASDRHDRDARRASESGAALFWGSQWHLGRKPQASLEHSDGLMQHSHHGDWGHQMRRAHRYPEGWTVSGLAPWDLVEKVTRRICHRANAAALGIVRRSMLVGCATSVAGSSG